ncbi:MAG: NUDIX hydrolase [Chloroflexota bacterium]|nr:MAG: ADP-ribose pyrophosphatase [Chloroflexota bacterium]
MVSSDPQWLEWAKRLQAAAQSGLTYARDPFDRERYRSVQQVAADVMAQHTDVDSGTLSGLFDAQTGHATPKVDVRAAVFRADKILLVKERDDGCWSLPGGWADVYDTPSEAAVREVFEETGYRTRAVKLLAVLDRDKQGHTPMPFHAYKLCFRCELIGGNPESSLETEESRFFPLEALPPLSPGRVTMRQIERFFEHYRHSELPSDFD